MDEKFSQMVMNLYLLWRFSPASPEDVLDHAVSHNHNSIRHGVAPVSIDQKGVLKNKGLVHEGS